LCLAFNDLKRRYWQSQNENQKFITENTQMREHMAYLQNQNRHLSILVTRKSDSYNRLEELYHNLRNQERERDSYFKELSIKIENLNGEKTFFQKEFKKALEDQQDVRATTDNLQKENKQVC